MQKLVAKRQKMTQLKINNPKIFLLTISLIVYVISLTQTAISSNELEDKTLSGIACLVMGGLAILGGGILEWIIWLANPLYFLSIVLLFNSNKMAKIFSSLATIIALSFTAWKEILVSESGRNGRIDSLDLGYWLWILSLTILTIGIFYISKNTVKQHKHSA
jgi:uncharacterized membrane protein YhaH (DUF805 family)